MKAQSKKRSLETPRVVIMQVVFADYRKEFFELLVKHFGSNLHVLTGEKDFIPTVVTAVNLGSNMTIVRNRYFLNRKILFQHAVIRPCVKADVAIVILNPRILSAWIILLIRKLFGKRTVIWGHAWSRSGKNSPTNRVRLWMGGLADAIIVYTETEAAELSAILPNKTVIPARNALYKKSVMRPPLVSQTRTDFIYVGRLVTDKKPGLLLNAFSTVSEKLPHTCNLVFVGSGPVRESLMQRTNELGLAGRVSFTGHISDAERLRELYSHSIASVSPGCVGLALTQSLGFGVPMIIADDEPHGPEVEAARDNENARFFSAGSVESLGKELLRFNDEADFWHERRETISKDCRDRYSCEAMAAAFITAITGQQFDAEGV